MYGLAKIQLKDWMVVWLWIMLLLHAGFKSPDSGCQKGQRSRSQPVAVDGDWWNAGWASNVEKQTKSEVLCKVLGDGCKN